ncbi:MAG: MarR family transcriptional regulator [bacterium]
MIEEAVFFETSPEDSSGYLLWQITMLWQRKIKHELDNINLTHTQFVLLATTAWLSKSNKVITQIDVANKSKTDRMMVSKVLRNLQSKGYLDRTEHTTDTRAKNLSLTIKGNKILNLALKIVKKVDDDFFSVLEPKVQPFNTYLLELMHKNEQYPQ